MCLIFTPFYHGLYCLCRSDGGERLGNTSDRRELVATFGCTPMCVLAPLPHRPCHSAIHRTYDNKTLAAQYHTLELLMKVRSLGLGVLELVFCTSCWWSDGGARHGCW